MKIHINSLTWDYDTINADGGEVNRICKGTRIEAEVVYPATETTKSVTFRGCINYNDKLCDMGEARKIVEGIINERV